VARLAIMKWLAMGLMLAVATLNLIPVVGVTSAARLSAMYGVDVTSPELELLLRHRAVLFGIVGLLVGAGAFVTSWRTPAVAVGLGSMLSFVVLQQLIGDVGAPLRRVVLADVIGSVALVAAFFAQREVG
jgi:hypothetical protein